MLSKLLKYDLKWTYKVLIIFYALTIFFAGVGRILNLISDSTAFNIMSQISYGIAISMMINCLINNVMRLWSRFISNIYKDESYLTHTLPVSKNAIYFSKIICTFITFLTTFVVIFVGIVICYHGSDFFSFLKSIITDELWSMIGLVIAVLILEILFLQMIGYLGIIIGYSFNNNKLVKSLIFGFVIYMVCSFISLLCLLGYGLVNSEVMRMFTSNVSVPDVSVLKNILILALILYLIYIILCNIISCKLFNKGVNVD